MTFIKSFLPWHQTSQPTTDDFVHVTIHSPTPIKAETTQELKTRPPISERQLSERQSDGVESLGDILTRMGKRVEEQAREQDNQPTTASSPPSSQEITESEKQGVEVEVLQRTIHAEIKSAPDHNGQSETTTVLAKLSDTLPDAEYIRVEPTLETSGCFPATKDRRYSTGEDAARKVQLANGGRLKYSPNAVYGDVNAFDFDVYRAIQQEAFEQAEKTEIIDGDTGERHVRYELRKYIVTSTTKLLRNAGKQKSKDNWNGVKKSLKRQLHLGVEGKVFLPSKNQYIELSGHIFNKVLTKGDINEDGVEVDKHFIWPSEWFSSSFNQGHHKLFDVATHRKLTRPIAKVLYPILEEGFFAATQKGGSYFEKKYSDLCDKLGINSHHELQRAKNQLDPSHNQLKSVGYIDSWEYRQTKEPLNIIVRYFPGTKYFEGQRERKRRKKTADELRQLPTVRSTKKRGRLSQREQDLVHTAVELGGDPENIPIYQSKIREYGQNIFEAGLGDAKDLILRGKNTGSKAACIVDCINRVSSYRATKP